MTNVEQQTRFILELLNDPVKQWSSEAMTKLVSDVGSFLQLCGLNEVGPCLA